MINNYFYHELTKKYVTYFGTLFNDIYIQRTLENGNVEQEFLVPISYGPKDKTLARLEQDPNLDKPVAIVLPRMSFEIIDMEYDPSRKLTTMTQIRNANVTNSRLNTGFVPVPYNIKFALTIYTKYVEDGFKILEQILPYFTPEWTSTLNLIPELGIEVDIPVVQDDLTIADRYEGSYENLQRRYIFHTLQFVMKGYFYGPVSQKGVINRSIVNIFGSNLSRFANLDIQSFITEFQPGNEVYQLNELGQRVVSGTVFKSNSSFLQISNVVGNFSNTRNLLCSNSNAIGEISNIITNKTPTETIILTPGLTANGEPTTNLAISIPYDEIKVTDNYGVNTTIIGV